MKLTNDTMDIKIKNHPLLSNIANVGVGSLTQIGEEGDEDGQLHERGQA